MNLCGNIQKAKIHIAIQQLGLRDEEYRTLLDEKFQVLSSKDLTRIQAAALLAHFEKMGWKPKRNRKSKIENRKYQELDDRSGMASPKQLRMIEAIWMEV